MLCDLFCTLDQPRVHYDQTESPRLGACVMCIGAFDGVHPGHQVLVRATVDAARRKGLPAVVYTFDPPPKVYFGRAVPLISLENKIARLGALGPDHIVVAKFDDEFRRRSAAEFIRELGWWGPREIWIGRDFRFGSDQHGNHDLLARFFKVRSIPPVCCVRGEVISSTRIRGLRDLGERRAAAILQGWRTLGVSTADVQ